MLRRMNGCQGGARAVHLTAGPPNASGAAAASVPAGDLGWPSRRSNTEPMKRRSFLKQAVLAAAGMASLSNKPLATAVNGESTGKAPVGLDAALAKDWPSRRSNTDPMKRRSFLKQAVLAAAGMASLSNKPLATAVNGES